MNNYLEISAEVKKALSLGKPVVALETTIVSHGMPYPTNLEVAHHCEQIIRDHGATPATIAIINGIIKVGLNDEELMYLATSKQIEKVSRRDLAYIVANQKSGATTVSATMLIAKMAGISVFATGGIGGVHRGVSETWDISADLEELAMTDVVVVCAGAKAILDLSKTLEYLETKGVPVIGFKTKHLPAFYTSDSGYPVPISLDSAEEVAQMFIASRNLGFKCGMLVTNPIDKKDELSVEVMNEAIEQALKEANEANITGKRVTPFLLQRVVELTGGESLQANQSLVYHNCEVASEIAVELAKLNKENSN